MAKATKEFQWRMDGILFAHKIVSEGGLEALEKEIRMRNYLKLDLWAKKSDVENLEFELSTNLYNSFLSTMLFTLHDTFGFAFDCYGRKEYQKTMWLCEADYQSVMEKGYYLG